MANKAFKFRLYPTTEQAVLFAKTFGCCRKIYNLMLADKIASYQAHGTFGSQTPAMYKQDYPYLKEVDSLALANVQLHLQQAFRNCFDQTRKKQTGFPQFKSAKRSRKSYTTNNQHGTIAIIEDRFIKLPKVGLVKAVIHRTPDADWTLKSATISQERDGNYFVSVLFSYEKEIHQVSKDQACSIGLDYKSDGLYMDHNGHSPHAPKYFRESQEKLAKEQRRLSRKTGARKGEPKSKNFQKQLQKVAKLHTHIANQRRDHLHKLSAEIANQYDIVCVESLNLQAMANKGFGNGKATLDNGYGMFLQFLEYKLLDRGKYLIKVDRWYPSSQICSHCGQKHKSSLSDRIYRCDCGLVMDRDHNAAINIHREGLRIFQDLVA